MTLSSSAPAQTPEFRGVWVDAWGDGFLNSSQIDTLVNHCRTYNFNAVIVQMRRRGDAFYMPQAPNLEPRNGSLASNFDALQELITKCKTGSPQIEVHCWIPTHLVGDSNSPNNPNHVMNLHPEFLMKNFAGETHIGEGYYLDPGHPGAQQWNYNVAMDIVSRYDIDGFHWDYIRYPESDSGYNDVAIARYNAEYGLTGKPGPSDAQFSAWRRRQVTDFLRWVNADLLAVKPNLIISASVFGSRTDAYTARFQDWAAWNEEGLIDICIPMNYTPDNGIYQSRTVDALSHQGVRRVYIGPAGYLNTKENTVNQLNYARTQGAQGVSLYSYRTPNAGIVNQTATFSYIRDNFQPTWANTPVLPWKSAPAKGLIKGKVTRTDTGEPVYNATVSINTSPVRTIKTDAHGSYAFFETTPGTYTISVSSLGLGTVSDSATVTAGAVSTLNLEFPGDIQPPAISAVTVASVTDHSATISWITDEEATSIVEYGTTVDYDSMIKVTNLVLNHSIVLDNLSPDTTYQVRVRSADPAGNEDVSGNFSFTTNPEGVVSDLIIESRLAGGALNSNPPYSDTGFANSELKSSASGLSGTGSRYAASGTPSFSVNPTLAIEGGTYDVYLTHGSASSVSDDIMVAVTGSGFSGLPSTTTIFQEPGANTWEFLGRMTLQSGIATPTLTFTYSSGTLSGASRMYSDAIKFVYVPTIPKVTVQPQSQTVDHGSTVVFTAGVTGEAPMSFQWKKGGSNLADDGRISGANSKTLTITDVTLADAGSYTLVVSNSHGSDTSAAAVLTVNGIAPSILQHPVSVIKGLGATVSFTVVAAGTSLSYEWRRNGSPIPEDPMISGQNTDELVINGIRHADAGTYTVRVFNDIDEVESQPATLTVIDPPVVTLNPADQTVNAGQDVTFTAAASGTGLAFQWKKNGVDIPGATTVTLTLTNVLAADAGSYTFVASNLGGSDTSNSAILTVNDPIIVSDPGNVVTNIGGTARFSVVAYGTETLSYQWKKSGIVLNDGGNISGATSAELVISNVQASDIGAYSVTVTSGAGGSVTSQEAMLLLTDGNAPTVKLNTPKNKQRLVEGNQITNLMVRISGTASDDTEVARVFYSLNGGPFEEAIGTTQWYADVMAIAGLNTIVVKSEDVFGNQSAELSRDFTCVVMAPLTVNINGDGTVKNNLDGQLLEIGKSYKMTAVHHYTNTVFTNWSHIVNGVTNHTHDLVVKFVMQSNLVLEANFIPNPFLDVAGIYTGLFYPADGIDHENSGYVIVKVTPKLGYSGKLMLDGNVASFSGKWDISGTVEREVARVKFNKPNLQVNLALDFVNGTEQITGNVSQNTDWMASLLADRYIWSPTNTPHAFTNSYTMLLPGLLDPEKGPTGSGYAAVTVNKQGRVKFAGGAADGHPIKQNGHLSKSGVWALYVPMYAEKRTNAQPNGKEVVTKEHQGSLIGWVTLTENTPAGKTHLAPLGTLQWTKTGWTNAVYPAGFTNTTTVKGSLHVAPPKGTPMTDITSATITLAQGNLSSPFANQLVINPNNSVTVVSPVLNKLKVGFAAKTGVIRGTFTHPDNGDAQTKWFGVFLQDYNYGRGYFVGPTEAGSVTLDEN